MFWLVSAAHAFCGTFVSSSGTLFNNASEIAVVREGTTTTLTMANDFEGDPTEFAMLVPVPEVVEEGDVKVVDPTVFDRLRAYTAPRLVSYTCETLYPDPPERGSARNAQGFGGCLYTDFALKSDESAGAWDTANSTEIEAQFIVGEYEIVVLSAEDSGDLLRWLDNNGYTVSTEAEDLLQEYIEAGSYFFAAKVFVDRIPTGQEMLSPLQFSYESEAFALPTDRVKPPSEKNLFLFGQTAKATRGNRAADEVARQDFSGSYGYVLD